MSQPFALLERIAYTPRGTFGRLILRNPGTPDQDLLELWTVERPWLDNQSRVSCIPEGTYPLAPSFFHKGGYPAYEVREVPGRDRILLHVGNVMEDVEGCVALGLDLGVVGSRWGVVHSREAHKRFMAAMAGRSGSLAIYLTAPARLPEAAGIAPR